MYIVQVRYRVLYSINVPVVWDFTKRQCSFNHDGHWGEALLGIKPKGRKHWFYIVNGTGMTVALCCPKIVTAKVLKKSLSHIHIEPLSVSSAKGLKLYSGANVRHFADFRPSVCQWSWTVEWRLWRRIYVIYNYRCKACFIDFNHLFKIEINFTFAWWTEYVLRSLIWIGATWTYVKVAKYCPTLVRD